MRVKDGSASEQGPKVPTFTELFRNHAPYIWRALVSLGVSPADADDLCQEVMLVVHRRLPDFDGVSIRGWLYGICLRVSSDYRRRARRRREVATEVLPDTPLAATQAEEVDARRAEARLLAVLDSLDEDKRAAFVLFEVEGLTLREISEAMGCPLQTAYSRLQVARTRVREAFGVDATEKIA